MNAHTFFSPLVRIRVFGEPDWATTPPTLFLLPNATAWEWIGWRGLATGTYRVICHVDLPNPKALFLIGSDDFHAVDPAALHADQLVRDLIRDQFNRGGHAVLIERGFDAQFLDNVLIKARVPCRLVEPARDGVLDLRRDHDFWAWSPSHRRLRYYFSDLVAPADYSADHLQRQRLALARRALEDHPALSSSLVRACVAGLKRRQFSERITDTSLKGKSMSGGMLLAVAWEVARTLRKLPGHRLGIVLPPGIPATVANLACLIAGKIPVNLNFTVGSAAVTSAMRTAGIEVVVSAGILRGRLKDFPWPEQVVDIADLLNSLDKFSVLLKRWTILWASCDDLARRMKLPRSGGSDEAGLLFTSGSSGEPKGVPLSHRNILANVAQIDAVLPRRDVPSMLGCLPVFHSFGFTVSLWWPLISGPRVVTYPSPLDFGKIIEVIEEYQPALYVTTPTFLRAIMKKARKGALACLNRVVTGAEKLPPALREEFEATCGVPVCEGYGMTETTPVISVNGLADPDHFVPGPRSGSVGPLLTGVDVQVRSPEDGRQLPLNQSGVLWFAGANVFSGYLGLDEKNREVLQEGWYVSGDIGRLSPDGFLFIEGRLSRFSKIAGEMVPHGTVEQHLLELARATPALTERDPHIAVFGKADSAKGEALVALIDTAVDTTTLRTRFNRAGLPNLWWPRAFVQVDPLPTLASGKLDLKRCQQLVDQSG